MLLRNQKSELVDIFTDTSSYFTEEKNLMSSGKNRLPPNSFEIPNKIYPTDDKGQTFL